MTGNWTMMALSVLKAGPIRFDELRRHIERVTQKALAQCLRQMEHNGLISRRFIASLPVSVEYAITNLGRSLETLPAALHRWSIGHLHAVQAARIQAEGDSPEI
ncbi:putative transcriptional regulator [Ketogulonicigenium robustum]|uniref:Putative transcriptional regulator n=1 Tax=Ketogulonicigenium robustum TaxID=92947 RepID=A0A1W6NYZ7_9RHOB|nr:putative transcriptional regulator [Ketogulonicigenium robustum]